MQNGDLLGPGHWSIVLRTYSHKSFFKLRYFTDLFLLLGVVIQRFNRDASDSVNGFAQLMFCHYNHPTFISRFALWFAKTFDDYTAYFDEYFGNPKDPGAPFEVYCRPILKRFFQKGE